MIRPSALTLARDCRYSAELGEKFPEASALSNDGTDRHSELLKLATGEIKDTKNADAAEIWKLVSPYIDMAKRYFAEKKLTLKDAEGIEVITEGTSDLVCEFDGGELAIIDYKGSLFGDTPPPNENDQVKAYGAAACVELGADSFTPILVQKGKNGWFLNVGHVVNDIGGIISSIIETNSKRSEPVLGDHCARCYRSKYCHAYQAQTKQALQIVDSPVDLEMTDETAALLSKRIDQVEDALKAAKAIRRDYIAKGGRIVIDGKVAKITTQQGRESANVAALKADGLDAYVKRGEPFEKITWVKDRKD